MNRKKAVAPGCSPIAQYLVLNVKVQSIELETTHEIKENRRVQAKRNGITATVFARTYAPGP